MVLNITSTWKDNKLKPRQIAVHSAWTLESDLQYKVLTQRFFTLVDLGRREISFSLPADKRIEINQYWTNISHSKLFKYWYQEHTSFLSCRASLSKFICITRSMNIITFTFKKINILAKLRYIICRIPSKN